MTNVGVTTSAHDQPMTAATRYSEMTYRKSKLYKRGQGTLYTKTRISFVFYVRIDARPRRARAQLNEIPPGNRGACRNGRMR